MTCTIISNLARMIGAHASDFWTEKLQNVLCIAPLARALVVGVLLAQRLTRRLKLSESVCFGSSTLLILRAVGIIQACGDPHDRPDCLPLQDRRDARRRRDGRCLQALDHKLDRPAA
jgi:hypothetical protein